jgi:hypothetical protein
LPRAEPASPMMLGTSAGEAGLHKQGERMHSSSAGLAPARGRTGVEGLVEVEAMTGRHLSSLVSTIDAIGQIPTTLAST